jgi:hypothetical protein
MMTPLDYEQTPVDYKKLIESDLSTKQVKEQSDWFASRLTPDINVPVTVAEGYAFSNVKRYTSKGFVA